MEAFRLCSTVDGATLNANSPTIAVARGVASVSMVPVGHPLAVEEGIGGVRFNSLPTSPPVMSSVNSKGLAEKAIPSPEKEPV